MAFATLWTNWTVFRLFSELSRAPSGSSKFLNGHSILSHLNEIRCSNLRRSAQAIELAIKNNRKLLDLTASDESVLLITFHVYQYEVKESAFDTSRRTGRSSKKTFHFGVYSIKSFIWSRLLTRKKNSPPSAFGGCSRLHLLDVEASSLQSTCNHLATALNDDLSRGNSKLSLNRTNKIWPKFNETNKIAELFQEFVADPSCRLLAVGSFENETANSKNLNLFCDLTEHLQRANERAIPGKLVHWTSFHCNWIANQCNW